MTATGSSTQQALRWVALQAVLSWLIGAISFMVECGNGRLRLQQQLFYWLSLPLPLDTKQLCFILVRYIWSDMSYNCLKCLKLLRMIDLLFCSYMV